MEIGDILFNSFHNTLFTMTSIYKYTSRPFVLSIFFKAKNTEKQTKIAFFSLNFDTVHHKFWPNSLTFKNWRRILKLVRMFWHFCLRFSYRRLACENVRVPGVICPPAIVQRRYHKMWYYAFAFFMELINFNYWSKDVYYMISVSFRTVFILICIEGGEGWSSNQPEEKWVKRWC